MRRWILALAATSFLAPADLARAQEGAGDPARGAVIFATKGCAGCHGAEAVGGMGPSLLGPNWKYGGDPASIAKSIREGHLPLMPPMGGAVSASQIDDVIAYLKQRAATITPDQRAAVNALAPAGAPKGVVHTDVEDFRVEKVVQVGPPYAFDFLPDGRILITETNGGLRIVDHGKLLAKPVIGAPNGDVTGMTQALRRAMLSVAVHPNYKANGWVYLLTAKVGTEKAEVVKGTPTFPGKEDSKQIVATITRGRLRDGHWVDSQKIIDFPIQKTNSLRMKFDSKGYLYVGAPYSDPDYSGAGEDENAQLLSSPEGKILRMKDDGSVPADNPFVGKPGAYPYVWSYGHREPSGLTFDGKGELWNVEDGPRGGDELNHVRKGHNYGWPVITWGHRYDDQKVASYPEKKGMDQPVVNWDPSPAVSDVEWYGGSAFPHWKGSFFVGTMKARDIIRVKVDGDRATLVETVVHNLDRIRDIATGPDGDLYFLTDSGDLMRMVPAKAKAKR